MWITTRKNNKGTRYVYQERFEDKEKGVKVTLSVTLNSKNAHAKKMAAQMLREKFQEELDNGEKEKALRLHSLPLEQVCKEWRKVSDMTVKELTRRNHENYVRKILGGLPRNILFHDFTPALAEKILFRYYYLDKLSYNYCKSLLVTVKAVMRHAKKAGYISDITDYESIQLKKRPATPDELAKSNNKFLDHDELKECLSQLDRLNHRVCFAMEFLSLTGLRCGEMLAVRRQDVELDKGLLHVTGSLVGTAKNGEDVQRGTPKNVYSYRTITLNQRAIDIIEQFNLANKCMSKWGRDESGRPCCYKDRGYIFTTCSGFPLNRQYINGLLRQIQIPGKHISTHIFRHTHISMLAAMGVPVKAIMARVGHNDPKTTLSVYTHITQDMQEKLDSCLDKMTV